MNDVQLPPTPGAIAEIRITEQGLERTVVLTQLARWDDAVLDGDVRSMIAAGSTTLEPRVRRGEGLVLWLHGYGLGALDHPGDTVRQTSLLLELAPGLQPGVFKAALWSDRGAVPRDLYVGVGTVDRGDAQQVLTVDLTLQHAEHGEDVSVVGIVRRT